MAAPSRFSAQALVTFATHALTAAGLDKEFAVDVAEVLVEGDLLGHDTHGLQLLAPYLNEVSQSTMTRSGAPKVVSERSSVAAWDGQRLPGPWLVRRALAWAEPRAREHGTATVVIRRSHHIGCLAAYLEAPARAGLMVTLSCSDPSTASVAPYGGCDPVFTPNPIAVGIPTAGQPILIDVSASITTNGMSGRLHQSGQKGAHAWWLDAQGNVTHDAGVIFANPPGTILPVGGLEAGHKGYGLALMIEALTAGLSGHGRADPSEGWGATVYLQLQDPSAFAGADAFIRQSNWLVDACHAATPRVPGTPVRLPGERGLARKSEQLREGVQLQPGIQAAIATWAEKLSIEPPAPLR